jgi:hypothetical protein
MMIRSMSKLETKQVRLLLSSRLQCRMAWRKGTCIPEGTAACIFTVQNQAVRVPWGTKNSYLLPRHISCNRVPSNSPAQFLLRNSCPHFCAKYIALLRFSKSQNSAVGKATKLRFGARISVEATEFPFSKTSGPNSGSGYYGEDNYFLALPGMEHRILGCPPHSLVMVVTEASLSYRL